MRRQASVDGRLEGVTKEFLGWEGVIVEADEVASTAGGIIRSRQWRAFISCGGNRTGGEWGEGWKGGEEKITIAGVKEEKYAKRGGRNGRTVSQNTPAATCNRRCLGPLDLSATPAEEHPTPWFPHRSFHHVRPAAVVSHPHIFHTFPAPPNAATTPLHLHRSKEREEGERLRKMNRR